MEKGTPAGKKYTTAGCAVETNMRYAIDKPARLIIRLLLFFEFVLVVFVKLSYSIQASQLMMRQCCLAQDEM